MSTLQAALPFALISATLIATAVFFRPILPLVLLLVFFVPSRRKGDIATSANLDQALGIGPIIGVTGMAVSTAISVYLMTAADVGHLERLSNMLQKLQFLPMNIEQSVADAAALVPSGSANAQEISHNKQVIFGFYVAMTFGAIISIPFSVYLWWRKHYIYDYYQKNNKNKTINDFFIFIVFIPPVLFFNFIFVPDIQGSQIQYFTKGILYLGILFSAQVSIAFYFSMFLKRTHTRNP